MAIYGDNKHNDPEIEFNVSWKDLVHQQKILDMNLCINFYNWMQQYQDISAAKKILEVDTDMDLFIEFEKHLILEHDNKKIIYDSKI